MKKIKVIYANMVVLLLGGIAFPLIAIAVALCMLSHVLISKKWKLSDKDLWQVTFKLAKSIEKLIEN